MINLYTGTPGSGKSLAAAYKLIAKIEHGCNVIANFPIDKEYFKRGRNKKVGYHSPKLGIFAYKKNHELNVRWLKDFALFFHEPFKESQTLIIIDECSILFNCRNWNIKDRQEWVEFFQLHRKLGFDILLITQKDKLVDKQILSFVEMEYRHRAVKNYKFFGSLISKIFGGLFLQIEYWYTARLRCSSDFFLFNKKKAAIYDTFSIFD